MFKTGFPAEAQARREEDSKPGSEKRGWHPQIQHREAGLAQALMPPEAGHPHELNEPLMDTDLAGAMAPACPPICSEREVANDRCAISGLRKWNNFAIGLARLFSSLSPANRRFRSILLRAFADGF